MNIRDLVLKDIDALNIDEATSDNTDSGKLLNDFKDVISSSRLRSTNIMQKSYVEDVKLSIEFWYTVSTIGLIADIANKTAEFLDTEVDKLFSNLSKVFKYFKISKDKYTFIKIYDKDTVAFTYGINIYGRVNKDESVIETLSNAFSIIKPINK